MLSLEQQIAASERLFQAGFERGAAAGCLVGIEETVRAYRSLSPEEFAEWVTAAERRIAIEREHTA